MSEVATLGIVAASVVVGALLQRVSGAGVGMVVAPVLALLIGPAYGVLATNAVTIMSGLFLTIAMWRQIDWRRWRMLAGMGVIGVIPGAWLVATLSAAWLQIVVGGVVLLGIVTSVSLRHLPPAPVRSTTLAAGLLGGLCNATAGVSAPVMVIGARMTRWDQHAYAATMQPTFLAFGIASVVAKLAVGVGGAGAWPSAWLLPTAMVAVVVGALIGAPLARRISASSARRLALVVAGVGAAVAVLRGLLAL